MQAWPTRARHAPDGKHRIRGSRQVARDQSGIESKVAACNREIRFAPSTARASIAYATNEGAVALPVAGIFAQLPTAPSPKPSRSGRDDDSEIVAGTIPTDKSKRLARSTVSTKKVRN